MASADGPPEKPLPSPRPSFKRKAPRNMLGGKQEVPRAPRTVSNQNSRNQNSSESLFSQKMLKEIGFTTFWHLLPLPQFLMIFDGRMPGFLWPDSAAAPRSAACPSQLPSFQPLLTGQLARPLGPAELGKCRLKNKNDWECVYQIMYLICIFYILLLKQ